jgi:hypothetical protein
MAIAGLSASVCRDHNVNPALAARLRSLGYEEFVNQILWL